MASSKSERKKEFLRQNPICCFCGGQTLATTEDHVPSRQMFRGKCWPEGYVFPACERCNGRTGQAEQFLAFLSRATIGPEDVSDWADVRKAMGGFIRNKTDVAGDILPTSSREVRNILRSFGMRKPSDMSYQDVPVAKLDGPGPRALFDQFFVKLFCALHYKHTGAVLPHSGGIACGLYTNATMMKGEVPEILLGDWGTVPEIKRGPTDLRRQFVYKYDVSDDGTRGAYLAMFRDALMIFGIVGMDERLFPEKGRGRLLRPFSPSIS